MLREAETLAAAGLAGRSADAFLAALAELPEKETTALQWRAAEQLIKAGRIDEGVNRLERVLSAEKIAFAATPRAAITGILWGEVRLMFRGLKATLKPPDQIPGEAARLCKCLAMAAAKSAAGGTGTIRRTRELIAARVLASNASALLKASSRQAARSGASRWCSRRTVTLSSAHSRANASKPPTNAEANWLPSIGGFFSAADVKHRGRRPASAPWSGMSVLIESQATRRRLQPRRQPWRPAAIVAVA